MMEKIETLQEPYAITLGAPTGDFAAIRWNELQSAKVGQKWQVENNVVERLEVIYQSGNYCLLRYAESAETHEIVKLIHVEFASPYYTKSFYGETE